MIIPGGVGCDKCLQLRYIWIVIGVKVAGNDAALCYRWGLSRWWGRVAVVALPRGAGAGQGAG